uniref:Uncharacterized protein n=1 Tax=Grammatophora oceanica TaxID=210454 RepID=A0A7S1VS62_9STRA|mmetsp:Transcript_52733/g.78803  ORF Transcript_52733/g.78803 Transcript_52733/m.78803 type:complete len:119 (+) Transcript_52733:34-390(+)
MCASSTTDASTAIRSSPCAERDAVVVLITDDPPPPAVDPRHDVPTHITTKNAYQPSYISNQHPIIPLLPPISHCTSLTPLLLLLLLLLLSPSSPTAATPALCFGLLRKMIASLEKAGC